MIDLTTTKIKDITYDVLVEDAKERGEEAIKFLIENACKTVERKKNGIVVNVEAPVSSYRTEYLKKFCGYAKGRAKMTVEEKRAAAQKRLEEKLVSRKAELEALLNK